MTEHVPVAFSSRRSVSDSREGGFIARGEGEAIEIHIPSLRRYACTLTHDADEADDLVQDCLERAFARFHRFRYGTNLRAWLFTLLRNIHFDERRREARRAIHFPLEGLAEDLRVSATQLQRLELRELEGAFCGLSTEHRQVLRLAALENFTCEEISEILHVGIGTVKSRLFRARASLRQAQNRQDRVVKFGQVDRCQ
jgi:RNA polymerase sigma-70 factor (ECF subfamily)